MAIVIDEALLPVRLSAHPMTDQEFSALCAEHPDLFFEMTAEGEVIVIPPTHTVTDARNAEILGQLRNWARKDGRGTATGSSGGWVLPNGARRSPDAAWTLKTRFKTLDKESFEGFWHFSPDFVIELKSDSDRLPVLRGKMAEWVANGAQLACLVNPDTRTVEVYRPNGEPQIITGESVAGEGPVDGFILHLDTVWDPFQ
jgi:Uma2 family endonuclease